MNEWFGLGIALELRDNMSRGLETARNSFDRFRNSVQDGVGSVEQQMNRLNQMQFSGAMMANTGKQMLGIAQSMLKPVVQTGSQFEQWRMTLKALYKDADLAKEKLNWGMSLAAKTPFEMTDITQALIGFKAVGAEADKMFNDANGQARSFLEYMGDLAALRPDVGLQGVMLGVRNLLGGDGGKSLKMRMDIDLEQILGRDFGEGTEAIMQDLVTVSQKLANGLMGELEGTWSQLISNLKDQSTRFFLSVADNGAFETIKKSLMSFSKVISEIDDEKMAKIGKNVANAFNMMWKPIDWVIQKLTKVVEWVIKLAESDSLLSKIVLGFVAFGTSLLAIGGALLTFGGGLIQTISSLGIFLLMLQTSPVRFTGIFTSLKLLALKLVPLIALVGGLSLAWKKDFGGIRTTLTNFVNTTKNSWNEAKRITSLGVTDMMAEFNKLDTATFGGWLTAKLIKLMVLWEAVCDAWNDNELSDETFQKVQALGLLPLLNAILDFKQRCVSFWEGFKKGWQNVSEFVSKVISAIGKVIFSIIDFFFPVEKGVEDVSEALGGVDIAKWEKFGEITAYIVSFLGGLWVVTKVIGIVVTLCKWIWSIGGAVVTALGWIGGLVTAIAGLFGFVVTLPAWVVGAIVVAIGAIIALVVAYWEEIKTFFSNFAQAWNEFWGNVGAYLYDKLQEFKNSWNEFWGAIGGMIYDWWQNKLAYFSSVIESIKQFFSGLGTSISNTWQSVCDFFSSAWDSVCSWFGGKMDWLSSVSSGVCQAVKDVWGTITGFFSGIWDSIQSTASTFFNWIGEKFSWVADLISGVGDFFGNVASGASNLWDKAKSLVGLNTGGYVKEEGVAMLHPNEVVVNDELTQGLRTFLTNVDLNEPKLNEEPQQRQVEAQTQNNSTSIMSNRSVDNSSVANDNSVTFSEGAIQINLQSGTEQDADKLAKMIMDKIKREMQLRNTLNYKPI